MITVSKVLGESFDLETREEKGKCLVLTNGRDEVLVSVTDDDIKQVLKLMDGPDPRLKEPVEQLEDDDPHGPVNLNDEEPDQLGEIGGLRNNYRDTDTGTESI